MNELDFNNWQADEKRANTRKKNLKSGAWKLFFKHSPEVYHCAAPDEVFWGKEEDLCKVETRISHGWSSIGFKTIRDIQDRTGIDLYSNILPKKRWIKEELFTALIDEAHEICEHPVSFELHGCGTIIQRLLKVLSHRHEKSYRQYQKAVASAIHSLKKTCHPVIEKSGLPSTFENQFGGFFKGLAYDYKHGTKLCHIIPTHKNDPLLQQLWIACTWMHVEYNRNFNFSDCCISLIWSMLKCGYKEDYLMEVIKGENKY